MYPILKRFMDILLAVLALILLSPVWVITIITLSVTGEREVFYRQIRIGFRNQEFGMFKFVTMVKNSLQIGTGAITLRNDPRVTRVGKYLRKTKINELPQLINVLTGEMSMVGPRPLVTATFKAYPVHMQKEVYASKPGITGIGSIIFRDEEKLLSLSASPQTYYKDVIAPYKGELEMWYNRNKSIITDIKIILITAWVILFPKSNVIFQVFRDLPKRQLA
jgi:lipopolysaccharide/colanic/teichoic acid biosynthesis glycosyltransferase